MVALRDLSKGPIRFAGVGGEQMAREGLSSLFNMADIAIIGLWEVLPKIPKVLQRVRETVADIMRCRPAVLVTIDSWGFTGRIHKALRALRLPVTQIHYVAPMVWVWHKKRARDLAGSVDYLMTLFSHEPGYFTRAGVPAVCVGHPIIESRMKDGDGSAFRTRYSLPARAPLLCVLPGSRYSEMNRLLPVLSATVQQLSYKRPNIQVVVPTITAVAASVTAAVLHWPVPVHVVHTIRDKYDAFAAADVALTAAGTVVLELALASLPMIVTYKVTPLSAWLFRRLSYVQYISLVNLLLNRPVVPELLQEQCQPLHLAAAVEQLLEDVTARAIQRVAFRELIRPLGGGPSSPSPSVRAARLILDCADSGLTGFSRQRRALTRL